MKRGQINSHVFIYIFIALFTVFILVFGFILVQKGKKTTEVVQLNQISRSLANVVSEYEGVEKGNKILDFSLPSSIRKVCIASGDDINPLVDSEFVYQGDGLYFIPGEYFKIDGFNLDSNPLCSDVNGNVQFEIVKDEDLSLTLTEAREECKTILYEEGGIVKNIDIVFLNHNLEKEDFSSKVSEYVNVFLSKEPLNSNREYFNFYFIEKKVKCNVEEFVLVCDEFKAKELALKCPHDYIIVLSDSFKPVRSSAKGNIISINIQDNKLVLLHEFGHVFGRLDDEYYLSGIEAENLYGTNCKHQCPSDWDECHTECSLALYIRSSDDSLMRSYGKITSIDEFNAVSKKEILGRIEVYK